MSKFEVGDVVTLDPYYKDYKTICKYLQLCTNYIVLAVVDNDHILLNVPSLAEKAIFNASHFILAEESQYVPKVFDFVLNKRWKWLQIRPANFGSRLAVLFEDHPKHNGTQFVIEDNYCSINLQGAKLGTYVIFNNSFIKVPAEKLFCKKDDRILVLDDFGNWQKALFAEYSDLGDIYYYINGKSSWTSTNLDTKIATANEWKPFIEEEEE